MASELLPCPWCGVQPDVIRRAEGYQIYCNNMDCEVGANVLRQDYDTAAEHWNRRTPPTVPLEVREAIESALEDKRRIVGDTPEIETALRWLHVQGKEVDHA